MTECEAVGEDLGGLVDGDREVIARHAEHLAGCDACRDARHDAARLGEQVAGAAADYATTTDVVAEVLAKIDAAAAASPSASTVSTTKTSASSSSSSSTKKTEAAKAKAKSPTPIRSSRAYLAIGLSAAATAVGALAINHVRASHSNANAPGTEAVPEPGSIAKLTRIDRAAADHADGVTYKTASSDWRPLHATDSLPAGAELRTDDRTRAQLALADGTVLTLDHRTTLAFDRAEPRHIRMPAGHLVAEVTHVDGRPASFATPSGTIDVVGTRFALTATDTLTSVQVARGVVTLTSPTQHDDVRAGEEGIIDHGALSVAASPAIAHDLAWAELEGPATATAPDDVSAGLGSLRAYKPGETRDRDWNLALATHDVKVRIVGPIARTEITETFRNDSAAVLEGVYQFPLPADAQIDALSLDSNGGFVDGAFVDKERGAKIWQGVIQKATPHPQQIASSEIIWVPGRWRDPALLEWKRGGRFELKVYPIPANGQRTIKLAYTQVVAPHGSWRQYVYPLPHSHDGSTVADHMSVDVEVRGAAPGLVRTAGYELAADPARRDVNALTLTQTAFVPRGDLVVDYRAADGDAELRAWTYAGGAAVAPDDKLAATQHVGLDPKVVAAQHEIASDIRPTAVLALHPVLPRWRQDNARDYMIVVDASQSMVGERATRARQLAAAMIAEMDRRDRFSVMTCDSECRSFGDVRAPSAGAAAELATWLTAQSAAGATDVVASIRAGAGALPAGDRDRWVLYIGDGFASTGFRREADVERALADPAGNHGVHVTTIGIGADADAPVLAAAARGGGGSYLAWVPGQQVGTAAIAALDTTYGVALRDATVELPAGLTDVAPAVLPTLRAGEELLLAARVSGNGGDVAGEVVVRGTVGGQPFEQRYPIKLAVSSAPGNGFVPRLWASLAIAQLEQHGTSEDRAKIVALSQGYSVMSRETSLLVLESQAMFDAFGVDRHHSAATWTGEEQLDEVASVGDLAIGTGTGTSRGGGGSVAASLDTGKSGKKTDQPDNDDGAYYGDTASKGSAAMPVTVTVPPPPMAKPAKAPAPPAHTFATRPMAHAARDRAIGGLIDPDDGLGYGHGGEPMVAMRRVWERIASVTPYDAVSPSITKAVADYDAALAEHPDSREQHRALVQALAYAGEIDRARDVAARWLERDPLDPQALGYQADLLGRDGQRDLALRTLAGLVDLDPDRVALHERMIRAYDSVGRLGQACGHRLALAALAPKDLMIAGGAVRCLRALGRDHDAELVLRAFSDDKQRSAVEKAATVAPLAARVEGDLVVRAHWDGGADLDVSIVSPEGTRLSWMGGRTDLVASDVTSAEREQLAIKSLKRGNYLVEISRGAGAASGTGSIHGTLDVTVLGVKQSLPFELTGERVVVGRVTVQLESHLEEIDNGERWRFVRPDTLAPMR